VLARFVALVNRQASIAATLIHSMLARKARFGLATMCIGAGQGIATIFEAV
jgi:acetyl-CoA acyltransferase